ncbi:hypothetical protein F183_A27210 [Bryobacterales bacterium F-183]|nr:hypothetical protein F183_A27210 [Bryobacterales bacterium F-183]
MPDPTPASNCPLCRSSQALLVHDKDRHGRPLRSLFCLNCGLFRVDPLPDDATLRQFYEERYRAEYKGVLRPKPHHVIRAAAAARDRLSWLTPHATRNGQNWLDVGAGSGEFAYLMQRKGFSVTALEPNRGYAEYMQSSLKLSVQVGFLEDLNHRAGEFDGISAFHMLEHHPDPVAALRRMATLLRPAGLLAIEVPNAAFHLVHPSHRFHPAHLVHFHLDNLHLAAAMAGFQPLELRTSSDGGILWGIFRRATEAESIALPVITQEQVQKWRTAELRRTPWRYYANPQIWLRTGRRLLTLATERMQVQTHSVPLTYLTQLPLPD